MKIRILVPAFLILSMAGTAFASEITGSLSAGSGSSVTGTVVGIPTAAPAPGTYSVAQSVALSSPGTTSIVYTTDGTDPTCAGTGTTYTGAISVAASLTIKAISCYSGGIGSSIGSYPYIIGSGSLTGTVVPTGGSLTGTVAGGSGTLTGTVSAPSTGGSSGGGGGGGGGGNGPPVSGGSGGGGGSIIPTSTVAPAGEVLGATTGSTIPGVPNTGAGGNAIENILLLIISGVTVCSGIALIVRRSQMA